MLNRSSRVAVSVICAIAWPWPLQSSAQQTQEIEAGDKVVTTQDSEPVKSENTVLLTLPKGTELTTQEIDGAWIKVTVERAGKKTTGWLYAKHVSRTAVSASRAAAEPYFQRGTDFLLKGHLDSAIAELSEAIRLAPKFAEAYNNRGTAFGRKGNFDRAIADYTVAIRLNPKDAEAWVNRGDAYYEDGNFKRAQWDALRPKINPNLAKALSGLYKGDVDRAIADYDEAIRVSPKCGRAYNSRGLAYQQKGDHLKAEADFAKARELGYKPEGERK